MPHGVIFDMDGVMVLTENAHWKAWQSAGLARGVAIEYGTFLSCFGRVNADCIRIMFGEVPPAEAERLADVKEAAFRDIIRENVPLAPGLSELLLVLRSLGVGLGVGSSAPCENVDLVLDAGRLRGCFGAVVDGSQVVRGKPAPDVFLRAADQLGVHPSFCAVIEDAPAGIIAARSAGMLAVALETTHKAHELIAAGAHTIYPDVGAIVAPQLLRLIDGHARRSGAPSA